MLQKSLRLVALFLLIALILSPVYFRHVRHYVSAVSLTLQEADNITENFLDIDDPNFYSCNKGKQIQFPTRTSDVQVLHFTSPKCTSCIEESYYWNKLPAAIYDALDGRNPSKQIEIINVLKNSMLEHKDTKDFVRRIMYNSETGLNNKAKSINASVCIASMSDEKMQAINIDLLPSILVMKNGKVVYSVSGQTSPREIETIAGIVAQNME